MKMKVWSACFALSVSALLASCGGSAGNGSGSGFIPVVPGPTPVGTTLPPADAHPTTPVNACGASTAVKMSCPPTASSS